MHFSRAIEFFEVGPDGLLFSTFTGVYALFDISYHELYLSLSEFVVHFINLLLSKELKKHLFL